MKLDRRTLDRGPWRTLTVLLVGVALSFVVMFALSLTGIVGTLGSAVIVLFGIALTFAALAAMPVEGERPHWPIGPAAVVSTFGWMFMVEAASWPAAMGFVWPIVLIAFFAWEVYQFRDHGHGSSPAIHA